MMYATPQYYQELQAAFSGPKLVKQEMLEELTDMDRPVDMSLSSIHNKAKSLSDIAIDIDHLSYEKSQQIYNTYMNSFRGDFHEHSPGTDGNKLEDARLSVSGSHPLSLTTPMSPQGTRSAHLKDEGNLSIPTIVNKNNHFNAEDLAQAASHQRAKREFVPDNKKDDSYWSKRLKNNDSARRSRVKRKAIEKLMETRLIELQKENIELKHEVAALRRRYGKEEDSSSDSSSTREKASMNSPMSSPSPTEGNISKGEDEQQSSGSDDARSIDDSRGYSMRSVTALNHSLGPANRERADSVGSSSSSATSGSISANSRPDSRSSHVGYTDTGSCTSMAGALDLSSDHRSHCTTVWESSSRESFSSVRTNSTRRSSCVSSDSSSLEEGSTRLMIFPLKCRWKKEMQST
ncbi:unnamed protein product [Candidula unifasciata]|uniref:BZIP domain-containing protein n=1 Tax=Candidula unifasciata TaxID=100452 RepID=A0A8S3ZKZ3_9EUPU|nr:unnamed protein product [Candidula unifasciata]